MIMRFLSIGLVIAAAGCSKEPNSNHAIAPKIDNEKCVYVGNDPNRHYCATTYYQILADPNSYEGTRVRITAWAVFGNGVIVVFPTEDSMLTAERNASIRVEKSEGFDEIAHHLQGMKYGSGRVVVGGVFRGRPALGDDSSRFGTLRDAELISH